MAQGQMPQNAQPAPRKVFSLSPAQEWEAHLQVRVSARLVRRAAGHSGAAVSKLG